MLTDYIKAALKRAKYKKLETENLYFGEIPELPGVEAKSASLGDCREDLLEKAERWLLLSLRRGDQIPVLDRIDLNARYHRSRKTSKTSKRQSQR